MAEIKTMDGGKYSTDKGSCVQLLYTERQMKFLLVTESDLSHLSLANWLVTGTAAFASFCLAQGIAIHLNAAFATEKTRDGTLLSSIVEPTFFILAAVGFLATIAAHFWRKSHLEIIKKESVERGK